MSNIAATEDIERCERGIRKQWRDLPDELILKILSYSEVKDLISCGQVSKRTRNISRDRSLWLTANLEKKIVNNELLEMTLKMNLSSNIEFHLRALNLSQLYITHILDNT